MQNPAFSAFALRHIGGIVRGPRCGRRVRSKPIEEVAIFGGAALLSTIGWPTISSPLFRMFLPRMPMVSRCAGLLLLLQVPVSGVLRAESFDLVIRGARVVDGTGAPW